MIDFFYPKKPSFKKTKLNKKADIKIFFLKVIIMIH